MVFLVLGGIVLWAWQAPRRPNVAVRRFGRFLQALAAVSYLGVTVTALGFIDQDECGRSTGLASDVAMWLFFACVILFIVGLTMMTTSEWAAIFAVATLDFGLTALMAGATSHRRLLITLLLVHGICTVVAGWWSWRVRDRTAAARAKGSEAGRTLAAGWIIVMVLQIGLSDEDGLSRSAADTQLLALFIVAAITVAMGTGYTKYIEARDSATASAPTPGTTEQRGSAGRGWNTRYRE